MELTEADAEKLAAAILAPRLAPYNFRTVTVRSGPDHDGDASLFVEAFIDTEIAPVEGEITADVVSALHDALLQRHDRRFPYLTYKRPGDEAAGSGDD